MKWPKSSPPIFNSHQFLSKLLDITPATISSCMVSKVCLSKLSDISPATISSCMVSKMSLAISSKQCSSYIVPFDIILYLFFSCFFYSLYAKVAFLSAWLAVNVPCQQQGSDVIPIGNEFCLTFVQLGYWVIPGKSVRTQVYVYRVHVVQHGLLGSTRWVAWHGETCSDLPHCLLFCVFCKTRSVQNWPICVVFMAWTCLPPLASLRVRPPIVQFSIS